MDNSDVTLREHLESRLTALERQFLAEAERARESVEIARQGIEKRLDDLNRLRAEVVSDRSQFVQRAIYESGHKEIVKQLNTLSDKHIEITALVSAQDKIISRMEATLVWLARLLVATLLAGAITLLFRALTGKW